MTDDDPMGGVGDGGVEATLSHILPGASTGIVTRIKRGEGYGFIKPDGESLKAIKKCVQEKGFTVVEEDRKHKGFLNAGAIPDDLFERDPKEVIFSGDLFWREEEIVDAEPIVGDKLKFDWEISETKDGQRIRCLNISGGTRPEFSDADEHCHVGTVCYVKKYGDGWLKSDSGAYLKFDANDLNEATLKLYSGRKVVFQHHAPTKRATNIRAMISTASDNVDEDRIRRIEEEQQELRRLIGSNESAAEAAQRTANEAQNDANDAQQRVGVVENNIANMPTNDSIESMMKRMFEQYVGGGGGGNRNSGNRNGDNNAHNSGSQLAANVVGGGGGGNLNQNSGNLHNNAHNSGGGGSGAGGAGGGGSSSSGSNGNHNPQGRDPNVDPKGQGKSGKPGKKGSGASNADPNAPYAGRGSPAVKGGGGPGKVREVVKNTNNISKPAVATDAIMGGENDALKRGPGRPRKNSNAAKRNQAGSSSKNSNQSRRVDGLVRKNSTDDKSTRRNSVDFGKRASHTSVNINLPKIAAKLIPQQQASIFNIICFCLVFLTNSLCLATSPRVQPRLLSDLDDSPGLIGAAFDSEFSIEEELAGMDIHTDVSAEFGAQSDSQNNGENAGGAYSNDNNSSAAGNFDFNNTNQKKAPRRREVTVRGSMGDAPAVGGVNITIGMQNLGGVDEVSQKYVRTCNEAEAAGYQLLVTPELDWRRKTSYTGGSRRGGAKFEMEGVEREAGKVIVIPKLVRPVALVKGVAITILDQELADEFLDRWARGEVVAEGGDRYVTVHLKHLLVTGFYAPQQRSGRKEWEKVFFEGMDKLIKRKEMKWKRKIWLGDANTQVAVGKGRCVGPHGPEVAGVGGRRWGRMLEELNTVLVNSWIDLGLSNRYTFRGFSPDDEDEEVERYGATEIDQILIPGRWKSAIQEFERMDLGDGYDHMFIGCKMNCQSFVDVLHQNQAKLGGGRKKWIEKEDHHKMEVIEAFNRYNESMMELDEERGGIVELQTVLEKHRQDFLKDDNTSKKMKKMSGEFFVGGSEDVTAMWSWHRSSSRKKQVCGISKAEAAKQCQRVSGDPMWKDLADLPMNDDFFEGMPTMSEENLSKMEEEIYSDEFRMIVNSLRRGAAVDGRGLAVELLDFLTNESDSAICRVFNNVLEQKTGITDWDWRSKTSKNSPLYKQGDTKVSSNYRYLSIGPLMMKVLVTILTKRKRAVLQLIRYYSKLTLGFLPGVGVIESLLLYALMDESCMKFIEAEGFLDVVMELVDVRKAFPSSDCRYIDKSYEALGLKGTKWYAFIRGARVDSKYSFSNFREAVDEPVDTFEVDNGYKEGCTGSPDGYVMGYEPVMNMTERLREKVGSVGIKLISLSHVVRNPMVRMAKAIYGKVTEVGEKICNRISRTNFADDTSQYEQVLRNNVTGEVEKYLGECGSLEETWEKVGLHKTVIERGKDAIREKEPEADVESGGPALHIFRGVCAEIGSRENFGKYLQGVMGLLRNGLKGRNLGQQMNHSDDCDVRSARAWSGYYAFKSKICGIGIGVYEIGKLVVAVARSALQFGRTSRATSREENDRCQADEDAMVRRLLGINLFMMKSPSFGINMHDLRFRMRISDYATSLFYHKARQWAHWLRSEKLGHPLLTGVFLPEKSSKITGKSEVSDVEYITWAGKKLNQVRGRPDLIEEAYKHLCDKCMIPEYAVSAISMCGTDVGKRIYYILTREEFVRSMLADYRQGKKITEEKLEKRKKELLKRYQLRNPRLDSYKMYFERGYCCLCQEHGMGSEVRRERHFHLFHDVGLRGDDYEEKMNDWSVEEELWEKKLNEAMELRRKMVFMGEPAFLERNADKIELVKNRGAKMLGTYRCLSCDVNYTSSVDAMERHLEAHESKEVTKYYKLKGTENRFHCAEQNFTGGKCFAGQGTVLYGFIINGVKYNEGDIWRCARCKTEIEWKAGYNGKKIRRIVEKVEEHLVHIRIRGFCAEEEQSVGGKL